MNLRVLNFVLILLKICVISINCRQTTIPRRTCTTPVCTQAAKHILSNMKADVNPCDSFYDFACGSFLEKHAGKSFADMMTTRSMILRAMDESLSSPISGGDPLSDRIVKQFYRSCNNTEERERKGLRILKNKLTELSGWPVLEGDSWSDTTSWLNMLVKKDSVGFTTRSLLDVTVETDPVYPNRSIIIKRPKFRLEKKFYDQGFASDVIQSYYKQMVDAALLLGATDENYVKRELRKSLEFEIQLAKMAKRGPGTLYQISAAELGTIMKGADIPLLLRYLFLSSDIEITEDETIYVENLEYQEELVNLIRKTPRRVVLNYMVYTSVLESMASFNEQFHRTQLNWDVSDRKLNSRRSFCLAQTLKVLPKQTESLYLRHSDGNRSRQKDARRLANTILEEFFRLLDDVEWMDDVTKKRAEQSLETQVFYIGNPDEWYNISALSKPFHGLDLTESDLLENVLRLQQHSKTRQFQQLRNAVQETNEEKTNPVPVPVDSFLAYHAPTVFTGISNGYLQDIFFNPDQPIYIKYSRVAFLIGHELAHDFDVDSSDYVSGAEWEPETLKNYRKKTKCLIDQYSRTKAAPEFQLQINGNLTLNENMADHAGIQVTRRAYTRYETEHGEEPSLPGLQHYSNHQLFWLSRASAFCETNTRSEVVEKLRDIHSPLRARMMVPLMNSAQFARDWNCPIGSGMNPINKCSEWSSE